MSSIRALAGSFRINSVGDLAASTVENSGDALSPVKTMTLRALSSETVSRERNKKRGLRESQCLGALFLCGSEISVLLKGDICARLPCLLTSNSDWELARDAPLIIRWQKQ